MLRASLQTCAEACRLWAEECENHAEHGMKHCPVCAEACRRWSYGRRARVASVSVKLVSKGPGSPSGPF
jgi:hypothetical protein